VKEMGKVDGGNVVSEVVVAGQVYVLKYSSTDQDLSWATKGLVVSVSNGEAIPVLQRQIFYVDFDNLVIIPLGANKVLLQINDDGNVSIIFSEATEFINNFFSTSIRWNKEFLVHERGS